LACELEISFVISTVYRYSRLVCVLAHRRWWVVSSSALNRLRPWIFSLYFQLNKSNCRETRWKNQYLMSLRRMLFCWNVQRRRTLIINRTTYGICRKAITISCIILKCVRTFNMCKIEIGIMEFSHETLRDFMLFNILAHVFG